MIVGPSVWWTMPQPLRVFVELARPFDPVFQCPHRFAALYNSHELHELPAQRALIAVFAAVCHFLGVELVVVAHFCSAAHVRFGGRVQKGDKHLNLVRFGT